MRYDLIYFWENQFQNSVFLQHHFFKQHNCNMNDPSQKYNSRVAILYKDKLAQQIANSFKVYGYVLELPHTSGSTSEKQETNETKNDFFDEEAMSSLSISNASLSNDASIMRSRVPATSVKSSKEGPNINLSSETSGVKLTDYKPSVIGKRPAATKKGVSSFVYIACLSLNCLSMYSLALRKAWELKR